MTYQFIDGVGWADVVDYGTEEAAQAALGAYQQNFITQMIAPSGELVNMHLDIDFGAPEDVVTQAAAQNQQFVNQGFQIATLGTATAALSRPPVVPPSVAAPPVTQSIFKPTVENIPPIGIGGGGMGKQVGLVNDIIPKIGGAIGDFALLPVIIMMAAGNKRAGDFLPLVLILSTLNDNIPEPFNNPSGGRFNGGVKDGWY